MSKGCRESAVCSLIFASAEAKHASDMSFQNLTYRFRTSTRAAARILSFMPGPIVLAGLSSALIIYFSRRAPEFCFILP